MNKLLYPIAVFILISGSSCKRYLDTAYQNPNLPVTADPELVLPAVINNMHRAIAFDSRSTGTFVQYFARTASFDSWERHGYIPGSDAGGEIWRVHYWSFGVNILDMIENGKKQEKLDYVAVAYTILAWGWLQLADHHGEVILRQAFDRGRLQFDYDKQEEVYPHVISLIDSAMNFYATAENKLGSLATGDAYMYGGNISRWKKFAYGVKALAYHRYYLKAAYKPDSVIANVDRSLAGIADDAMVRFNTAPTDVSGYSFYGPLRNNFGTFRAGAFLINLMNGNIFTGVTDPRLKFLFRPSTDGQYRGVPFNQGDYTTVNLRPPSFWGVVSQYAAPAGGTDTGARYIYKNTAPFPIMTYSMLQFTKAEAAFKKGDLITAWNAYKNGISSSIDNLTTYFTGYSAISATDKTAYLANTAIVPATPGELTLRQIMLQKYIALYPWGDQETWVDMRRYNYDVTNIYTGYTIPSGTNLYPDNAGKLVYRVRPRYNSEYLWNIPSLKAIGAMDLDYHTKPVWFSQP